MITATQVPEDQRMDLITDAFGPYPFDTFVFRVASGICENYNGGYWEYYENRDMGEFLYMAPAREDRYFIVVDGNGFTDTVDADTFGIICTLLALGQLLMHLYEHSESERGRYLNDIFYTLREYALDHDNAMTIMQAID